MLRASYADPARQRAAAGLFAAALAMPAAARPDLFNNGLANGGAPTVGLATGALTSSGVPAPAGFVWSERPTGNTAIGFSANAALGNRLADNFTITDPGGWRITSIDTYAYVTDTPTSAPSPFNNISLQIWRGRPGDPGSVVVFGSSNVNRLAGSVQIMVLRGGPNGNIDQRIRSIWANTLAVETILPPGTYWIDIAENDGFNPPVTIAGLRGPAVANARQYLGDPTNAWVDMVDPGTPPQYPPVAQELPFVVRGNVLTSGGCYANCDGSTAVPFLNVNDFVCFQTRFAGSDTYANCDGSTNPPILNINDFICFQTRFAAGCTAP